MHAAYPSGLDTTPNLIRVKMSEQTILLFKLTVKKSKVEGSSQMEIFILLSSQMESHGMDLDMLGSAVASSGMTVSQHFQLDAFNTW